MKTNVAIAFLVLFGTVAVPAEIRAQSQQSPDVKAAETIAPSPKSTASSQLDESARADIYYYFTMGHLNEQQYELTGRAEEATASIDFYKKALAIEPGSPVIMERLAEIYSKSQRIRDAVTEAQEVLKLDPNNLAAHRLLARIYVRTLGDVSAGELQKENLAKAVDQFNAILKIDPKDTSSALWLARLYRFENQHAEAEKLLREVLRRDPDNGPALEQLSQILMDGGRPQEAIEILSQAAGNSSSPDVYDLLGDAYRRIKNSPKLKTPTGTPSNSIPTIPAITTAWGRRCSRKISTRPRSKNTKSSRSSSPALRKIICAWRSFTAGSGSMTNPNRVSCAQSNFLREPRSSL